MQRQRDGDDIHRVYGPRGTKTLKVAFDALFYQMFPGGDYPVLHDSGVVNLRGVHRWGPIFEKAYEVYGDEKYAWLLQKFEREYTEREHPGLPMSLQSGYGDIDAVRLSEETYPDGRFSLAGDAAFAPLGRHEQGCTLFPCHGNAVLRIDPEDEQAPAAYLFWGPHNAGHRAPAALHLDLHAGQPLTSAAELGGYGDPSYLTWNRTTIAHNTVTVDETPMFPYDYHADVVAEYDEAYIWESDQWRDTVSDGELKLFQPGCEFSAVRAINENVYPGVLLDRTVVVTMGYVLDAFRVISEEEHQYDWAMHCVGDLPVPAGATAVDLGNKRGYRHLQNARLLPDITPIRWTRGALPVALHLALPDSAAVMLANDPFVEHTGQGGLEPLPPNHSIIARARGKNVLFLACWQIGERSLTFSLREGSAASDMLVDVMTDGKTTEWLLPFSAQPVQAHVLVK
jgi:hypothetical protein